MNQRIKNLKIPPNWTSVKVSKSPLDYLQATGYDAKGKIQYIYHPLFVELTNQDKFIRLKNFINAFDKINAVLKKDKSLIAFLFKLLQKTYIRVGNDCYAKENKTYGLTTLEKRHFIIGSTGNEIEIKFNGKRSVSQKILIKDPYLIRGLKMILNNHKNSPGTTRIFEPITAIDMNNYLKNFNSEFTVKDFRTYYSNILFIEKLQSSSTGTGTGTTTSLINKTYDFVAEKLGHSKGISKKAYIYPGIAEKFIEDPGYFKNKTPSRILRNLIL
jgi:DNA topoisomerase-1